MRKIKEVLRLRFGLGLGQEQIARSCSIGQATVHRYLERGAAIGLGWPLPDDWDDQRLNELLFPAQPVWPPVPQRPGVDFSQNPCAASDPQTSDLAVGVGGIS
jgi:hypothetical protein